MAKWKMEYDPQTRTSRWVHAETGEADLREPPGIVAGSPPGVNTRRRPKPGEKPHKPSEELKRSLNRSVDDMERQRVQAQRDALEQKLREIDAGRITVDPDATIATPVVRIDDGEKTHYARADRVPANVKARAAKHLEHTLEEKRRMQAIETAKRMKERGEIAASLAAVGRPQPALGIRSDATGVECLPPGMDASTRGVDAAAFQTWNPERNPTKRFL